MKRLRGFKALVQEAVEQGSRAIERVQLETAKMPFDVLESIPGLKVPASGVRLIYATSVSGAHGMIRLVNKVAGDTLDVVLDTVEQRSSEASKIAGASKKEPADADRK